ncbi:MAG: saccharopine dehydrogenase family protein [Desulfobacterales bacterium]
MKVLVLGLGLQGKAVVQDLVKCGQVEEIVIADVDAAAVERHLVQKRYPRCRALRLDAARAGDLQTLIRSVEPRVVMCMLPADFNYPTAKAALAAGCHFVSSSYAGRIAELDAEAREKGVMILPEMGMDPGIDLVLARLAVSELDTVHGLYSYGAGLPEPACADDNPLRYKITWTFDGVLKAYKRPAVILKDGRKISIPGDAIFQEEHGHMVEVPGLGALEAYPNGDAIHYIRIFDLGPDVRDMGRFALRYPGHRQFWSVMAQMGFLDDEPVDVDGHPVSPRRFLVSQLTPRLQFADDERDMVVLRICAWGLKDGKERRVTYSLIDYRDLETGLFAMNRTVGYTASIGAQMILSGRISTPGVLSPTRDVPPWELLNALKARGMKLDHRIEEFETV